MIITEKLIFEEKELVKTFSDANKYIIQNETGTKYESAIDVPNKYTYRESQENIPEKIKIGE